MDVKRCGVVWCMRGDSWVTELEGGGEGGMGEERRVCERWMSRGVCER